MKQLQNSGSGGHGFSSAPEESYILSRVSGSLPDAFDEKVEAHSINEKIVLNLLKSRRERAEFFDAELFADPAWDVLLALRC